MDTGTPVIVAQPIKPHDQAQLLAKAHALRVSLASGTTSLAAGVRSKVLSGQLHKMVGELGADATAGDHARAIVSAIDARAYAQARAACDTFMLAVEGKPIEVPAGSEPEATPIAPAANDNHQGGSVPGVTDRAQVDPDRDHDATERDHNAGGRLPANDTNCSRKEEQVDPAHSDFRKEAGSTAPGGDPVENPAPALVGQIDSPDALGEVIRAARSKKGLSQQELAALAGVGRRFVGDIEGGKITSQIGCVFSVCAAAGLVIVALPA